MQPAPQTHTASTLNDIARTYFSPRSYERPIVRVIQLFELGCDRPFRSRYDARPPRLGDEWEFISEAFAEICGVYPEDVSVIETDDGDRIAVHGLIIGRVSHSTDAGKAIAAASDLGRAA